MLVENYKGVELFYNKDNGRIEFEFEGQERETKYVFEAERIIDEPVWEKCELKKGLFKEGVFGDFIGTAIAERKNIKTGEPDWIIKGRYDSEYKERDYCWNNKTIYPFNKHNMEVYEKFKKQTDIVAKETNKLREIIDGLKN